MINKLFIPILLLASYKDINNKAPYLEEFLEFKKDYNKTYVNQTDYWHRYDIFSKNYVMINEFNNNKTNTYTLGINQFADMTYQEFSDKFLMKKKFINSGKKEKNNLKFNLKNLNIPESIDWRSRNFVSNVKNQEACGSCWAFSAVGAIEGQNANKTGKLESYSEQNLVDCSYDYGNEGCDGGWPEAGMRYVRDNGIELEEKYPYTGIDGNCNFNKTLAEGHVNKTVNITKGSMEELYDAIATVGPISVAIDAGGNFGFYKSGIYTSKNCSSEFLDHAVLAVGYSYINNSKYIIVKNSWGTDWGMDGYIYMNSDIDNMCGIATDASYPLL